MRVRFAAQLALHCLTYCCESEQTFDLQFLVASMYLAIDVLTQAVEAKQYEVEICDKMLLRHF